MKHISTRFSQVGPQQGVGVMHTVTAKTCKPRATCASRFLSKRFVQTHAHTYL